MLSNFVAWLKVTPVSQTIQDVQWIIPLVQTIHILGIAVILSSAGMLNLRLVGLSGRGVSISQIATRFLPWIWCATAVLAVTGAILITGEPERSLMNPAFQIKMATLIAVLALTLAFGNRVRKNAALWDRSPSRAPSAWATAIVSSVLWLTIAVCGRLIAYVDQV